MIEVMRILKTLNVSMDRTVRIGLWSGEEEGLFGSEAYVKQHFGDAKTMKLLPDHAKLSATSIWITQRQDSRVYLQGNDAMRPLFEAWLAPFRDEGATTITIKNTAARTSVVGCRRSAGFQFIQDPLDYGSVTHHSSMDTYDHAVASDLMEASAVIAAVVYQAANSPEMLRARNCRRRGLKSRARPPSTTAQL